MDWRAYYANGPRPTSAELSWRDLPPTGLVGVVVYLDPPYRRIIDGHDWMWLDGEEFRTVTTHEKWGRWAPAPVDVPPELLKRGAGMTDEAFAAVQAEMLAAREAP